MTIEYSGYALYLVPPSIEVSGKAVVGKNRSILAIVGHKFRSARRISREKIAAMNPGAGFIHEHRVTQYLSVFTVGGSHGTDLIYTLSPHEHSRRTK